MIDDHMFFLSLLSEPSVVAISLSDVALRWAAGRSSSW